MRNGFNKLLILLAVFLSAFLAVVIVRKTQDGEKLINIIRGSDRNAGNSGADNASYTLRKKPSLDLKDVSVLAAMNKESAALVKAVVPSVVSIDTSGVRHERRRDFWGRTRVRPRAVQGQGSGVIVTKEGHVITNYHVIKGTPNIRLTMHDGKTRSARIIGADPTVDIAVLQIEGRGPFTPLKFGDSDKTQVGNIVYAIGSPFGLGESVTDGKISAKKRSFSDSQVDLLQMSAAINPGNSGGPLVNIQGEIIGINSRIYSNDKENPGFQGISFAIPSNAVLFTLQDILSRGHHARGFLGLALDEMDFAKRREFQYQHAGGVRVVSLAPDAPGIRSGLKKNDIIISFNGQSVINSRHLIAMIQQSKVDSKVSLEVWREGNQQILTATIGDAEKFNQRISQQNESAMLKQVDTQAMLNAIKIIMRNPTAEEKNKGMQGVIIEKIHPESQLRGKLFEGDLIRSINGQPVTDKDNFIARLVISVSFQNTEILLQRGKNTVQLTIAPMRK